MMGSGDRGATRSNERDGPEVTARSTFRKMEIPSHLATLEFGVTSMAAAFPPLIAAAVLLCTLTAGFLLGFAVVVMPGLRALDDAHYLRAFQVIDGVIQRGQPLFGLMWVGSVIAIVGALVTGLPILAGGDRLLLSAAGALYLLGVQLPTAVVNIPLNNAVQRLDVDGLDAAGSQAARRDFEGPWNRWNAIRTVVAIAVSALLIVLTTGF